MPSDQKRGTGQGGGTRLGHVKAEGSDPLPAKTYFEYTTLTRKRDEIMVHKDELEEIRSFDISTVTHSGIGGFLCSTALSLVADEYFRLEEFVWAPKTKLCAAAFVFGLLLCYFGFRDWRRKYNKLTKIIDQTKPTGPPV